MEGLFSNIFHGERSELREKYELGWLLYWSVWNHSDCCELSRLLFAPCMIEIYLTQIHDGKWELKATILPKGGIGGLAQDATIASVHAGTFQVASEVASDLDLSRLSFQPNPDRWPVRPPKFQIINDGSHGDRANFGNYVIRYEGVQVGRIENFPRGERGELIKRALQIVATLDRPKE